MKRAVLFLSVLLALFFLLTPLVAASAVKTPVTGVMTVTLVDPGKVWITADGIEQVKGAVGQGSITGDLSGSIKVVEDETIDLNTGLGNVHGTVLMTTADGTFEGHFVASIKGLDIQGKAVAMGTGVYEGQKMMGSFVGHTEVVDGVPTTISNVEGFILSPHG